MFSVLSCTISFVTSGSRSTTLGRGEKRGGIGGPSYEIPLRVVIAFKSPLGLATVLLGSELEPEEEAVAAAVEELKVLPSASRHS
ncbi:hypothetical protein Tco_0869267 [Tanacetum coccineum]